MSFHKHISNQEELLISSRNHQLAFRDIYDQYWEELYRFAFNVLGESAVCEDIVQEVFVSLWEKKNKVHIEHLSAYLYKAVKFQILNHIRNAKISEHHLDQISLLQSETYEVDFHETSMLENKLNELISQLPDRCKQVFCLSRFEAYSNQQIADHTGLSVQTIKNHISHALSLLRKGILGSTTFFILLLLLG